MSRAWGEDTYNIHIQRGTDTEKGFYFCLYYHASTEILPLLQI
jgi:hypothetical protein